MRFALTIKLIAALAAAVLLPVLVAEPSAASTSATTTFTGRFVCEVDGDQVPLAGARVELWVKISLHGFVGDLTKIGGGTGSNRAYGPAAYADEDGGFRFTVPQDLPHADEWYYNFYPRLLLDDGQGTSVRDYPNAWPFTFDTATNLNNKAVQDYRTQVLPFPECALWLALRGAYHDYSHLMGKRPPYGNLVADYDGPNRGTPATAYTTIVWPRGYAVSNAAARHEFAHTIRNVSVGGEGAFLDEVSQEDYRLRGDPCRRTTAQYAFHEGWAEFWAGDFSPAPSCKGVKPDDAAVEGNVAWTLTRIEHNCAAVSRKRMVEVLLAQGKSIHSLPDFTRALGVGSASCSGAPLDPATVPRSKAAPPVSDQIWSHDIKAGLSSVRKSETALSKLLPGAVRAAASASCAAPPCLQAIERKLAPSLIRGQLAQAHTIVTTLQTEMSIDAGSLRGHPTRRFIESVTRTPIKLAEMMNKVVVDSLDKALAAARPLATRDHSSRTQSVLELFRSQRAALVRAGSTAGHRYHTYSPPGCAIGWGGGSCWPGWSEGTKETTAAPTAYSHVLDFLSSDEKRLITFGSAAALGFRGALPKYVCPSRPDLGLKSGWAVAGTCDAPDVGAGFRYTGMLAKLTYPARSIWAWIGATRAIPGGLPVQVDGFDANGAHVLGTAVLVGSSTAGDGDWEPRLVKLTPSLHAHAITYVAVYVNTPVSSGIVGADPARLAIDTLGYTERPR